MVNQTLLLHYRSKQLTINTMLTFQKVNPKLGLLTILLCCCFQIGYSQSGCTSPSACNFDPVAVVDDGSCEICGDGIIVCDECDDGNLTDGDGCNSNCQLEVLGCVTDFACNYDPLANSDDGSCTFGPANDVCANAEPLTFGIAATGDNTNSCVEGPNPTCGGGIQIKDVWYSFTSISGGDITINTTAGTLIDTRIAVYDACGGNQVACNDDFGGPQSQIIFSPICGTQYFIQAGGFLNQVGSFDIVIVENPLNTACTNPLACNYDNDPCVVSDPPSCIFGPSNDECTNAVALSSGVSVLGDNTLSCVEAANPTCGGGGIKDVWFVYTSVAGGDITITTTAGTLNDTRIAIYDACGGNQLVCNDDYQATDYLSQIVFTSTCGETYWIQAGGYGTAAGTFNIVCTEAPNLGCTDPSACNYESCATDDGSCTYDFGCTNPSACNFNPTALCDDGSCIGSAANAQSIDLCTYDNNGNCVIDGTMCDNTSANLAASTLSEALNFEQINSIEVTFMYTPVANGPVNFTIDLNGVPLYTEVRTDAAICDDPSVSLIFSGAELLSQIANSNNLNFTWDANINLSAILTTVYYSDASISGCTDPVACNYNAAANCEDDTCILPPSNDQCANAIALEPGVPVVGDNTNACVNPSSTNGCSGANIEDVWYIVTAYEDGPITVRTILDGTMSDSVMAIYDACGGSEIACNDDDSSLASLITFNATCGTTYYVQVAGLVQGFLGTFSVVYTAGSAGECNDPTACNYSVCALTADDCTYPGCTFTSACNYDPAAGCDDGSCTGIGNSYGLDQLCAYDYGGDCILEGTNLCTNNFNTIAGPSTISLPLNYSFINKLTISLLQTSCTSTNLDLVFNGNNINTINNPGNCSCEGVLTLEFLANELTGFVSGANNLDFNWDNEILLSALIVEVEYSDQVPVPTGCTDPLACNYEPLACTDDGSCFIAPANDECSAAEFLSAGLPVAGDNSNSCIDGPQPGCGAGLANVDIRDVWYSFTSASGGEITIETLAGTLNDTRIALYDACGGNLLICNDDQDNTDYLSAITFNSTCGQTYYLQVGGYQDATGSFLLVYSEAPNSGCTDPTACNYEDCAIDDGSCIYASGCTEPSACNYDPTAQCDDGSCEGSAPNLTSEFLCTYSASGNCTMAGTICDNGYNYQTVPSFSIPLNGGEVITSIEIQVMYNPDGNPCLFNIDLNGANLYNEFRNDALISCFDDGLTFSYVGADLASQVAFANTLDIYWSTDVYLSNVLVTVNYSGLAVFGCIDPIACNFDPAASCDDGTCILPDGCNDPAACNFDPAATCNDGSCQYPAGATTQDYCLYDGFGNGCTSPAPISDWNIEPSPYSTQQLLSDGDYINQLDVAAYWTAFFGDATVSILFNGLEIYSQTLNYDPFGSSIVSFTAAELPGQIPGANVVDIQIADAFGLDVFISQIGVTATYSPAPVQGCTDPGSCSYNPAANCDDGTCGYPGCTYDTACNYDPTACEDDGSCAFPLGNDTCEGAIALVEGVTVVADNSATCIDGPEPNCGVNNPIKDVWYTIESVTGGELTITTTLNGSNTDSRLALYDACNGNLVACNDDYTFGYASQIIFAPSCGTTYYLQASGYSDSVGTYDLVFTENPVAVEGCTDPTACNYNDSPCAIEDGSCILPDGCTDLNACNYDPAALCDDGSCQTPANEGTQQFCLLDPFNDCAPLQVVCFSNQTFNDLNFSENVGGDIASITVTTSWTSCTGGGNLNILLNGISLYSEFNNFCNCAPVIAIVLDAATLAAQLTSDNILDISWDGEVLVSGVQLEVTYTNPVTTGCSDALACNYDPTASCDDGSCEYLTCAGCTDPIACNYNAAATIEDGVTCEYISCSGCTELSACNYMISATIDDGSCEFISCAGCTVAIACNYNIGATIDDGSCEYTSCAGCTYADANNFTPGATLDDNSCLFDPAVSTCPQDLNGDGLINTGDLGNLLSVYGTVCP